MGLRALKEKARQAAWDRGHEKLSVFSTTGKGRALAVCPCGTYVQVIEHPRPNEISIGGSAVAVGCVEEHKVHGPDMFEFLAREKEREEVPQRPATVDFRCSNLNVWGV